jgi:hypothetical protein
VEDLVVTMEIASRAETEIASHVVKAQMALLVQSALPAVTVTSDRPVDHALAA